LFKKRSIYGVVMKSVFRALIFVLILWPNVSFCLQRRLANEGKSGLYVRSIEDVLRLRPQEVDLATAALIVSEHWSDLVHGRRHLAQLDEMAREIQDRLIRQKLRTNFRAIPVINQYLFDELGFESISEASDPNDLFLHTVLNKKRGYCLSLSILYLSLGERLGLPLYGVVVPGHFFIRYDSGTVRFNIETTSKGGSIPDAQYIEKFKVPENNSKSIYMKNLNKIQTLGCFFNNLGNVYSDIGNLDSALLALIRAVEINPTLSESRANLGNVYLRQGQVKDAIDEYNAALENNPEDPKTYNNLGNAYMEKGWINYAISAYTQSLQLDPNFIDAYSNLSIAYCEQSRFSQAATQLKQALALEPRNPDLYCQLGNIYAKMNNYKQAISQYKKTLAIKPDLAKANYGLGLCYNKLGMANDEIQAYKRALTVEPDMLAALAALGNAYFSAEDFANAIEQYRKAVQLNPNDALIYYNLGAAHSNITDYKQAVTEYLKAIELDPDIGDAHYGLAFGYYMLKKYDLAFKHINIAKRLGVDIPKDQFDAIKSKVQ